MRKSGGDMSHDPKGMKGDETERNVKCPISHTLEFILYA